MESGLLPGTLASGETPESRQVGYYRVEVWVWGAHRASRESSVQSLGCRADAGGCRAGAG